MAADDSSRASELEAMIAAGLIDPEELVPKKKIKKPKQTMDYWDNLGEWQAVKPGDDFLLGAAEGGFAGLEILDGCTIFGDAAEFEPQGKVKRKSKKASKPAPEICAPPTVDAAVSKSTVVSRQPVESPANTPTESSALDEEQERTDRKRQRAQRLKQKRKERILRKKRKKNDLGKISDRIGALELAESGSHGVGVPLGDDTEDADEEELSGSQDVGYTGEHDSAVAMPSCNVETNQRGEPVLSKKERVKIARTRKRALRKLQRRMALQEEDASSGLVLQMLKDGVKGGPAASGVSEWRSLLLHPCIESALSVQGFTRPTPIQRECLPAAIRDRLDIIGAAQTGSGKTLAFGLPIMQLLMQEREIMEASGASDPHIGKLRALIMCPTRELALQVCSHLQAISKACSIKVCAIVGGLAYVKQQRVLASKPQVIVATPGRLWELMRENEAHLNDLNHLSFLVLDEADRMVQAGHYEEMTNILEQLPKPGAMSADTIDPDFEEAFRQDTDRQLRRCPPRSNRSSLSSSGHDSDADDEREPVGKEEEDEEEGEEDGMIDGLSQDDDDDDDDDDGEDDDDDDENEDASDGDKEEEGISDLDEDGEQNSMDMDKGGNGGVEKGKNHTMKGASRKSVGGRVESDAASADLPKGASRRLPRRRQQQKQGIPLLQTFVFSATLTLPADLRRRLRKGGGGASGSGSFEGLMDRITFQGEPQIVDLTTQRKLATRVEEARVECSDKERDEFLYYLLALHPGRTIVFVNAVSALRRVAALLKLLGLPAHALHAQQQQRQRLKALDRFKSQPNGVLVATDVAARGLDIKEVRCVIHYQLPASADTYIHRSGRTARADADGLSISIVTPKESARFSALCRALGREAPPPGFPIDVGLMPQVHKRMQLAIKVDELGRKDRKSKADRAWVKANSKLLDLEYSNSDSSDEDGIRRPNEGRGGPQLETLQAQLSDLLATPLQHRMSNRFFTGGAASAVVAANTRNSGPGTRKKSDPTGAGETPAQIISAVPKAVALASRLQENKEAAQQQLLAQKAKVQAKAQRKKEANTAQAKLSPLQASIGKKGKTNTKGPKQLAATQGKQRRGMVVIPPIALGRKTDGPEALDALRKRLALLGS